MDRDGLAASVIYGPLALGLPIDDPALQDGLLRRVERLGGRGVQRGRARPAVRARVPARALARGGGRRARALRGARAPRARSSTSSTSTSATRPGTGSGPPRSTPASRSASTSRAGPGRGSATRWASGSRPRSPSILPLQLDEPLATMVFCGALERHPGFTLVLAESGIGWLPYFLARMDLEWQALRDKLDDAIATSPSELFRRQVMATFEEDALAGAAHPAARRRLVHVGVRLPAHRQHVPATRCTRSRRRSARCPPTTGARSPRRTAPRLYGFADGS